MTSDKRQTAFTFDMRLVIGVSFGGDTVNRQRNRTTQWVFRGIVCWNILFPGGNTVKVLHWSIVLLMS